MLKEKMVVSQHLQSAAGTGIEEQNTEAAGGLFLLQCHTVRLRRIGRGAHEREVGALQRACGGIGAEANSRKSCALSQAFLMVRPSI